MNPRGFTQHRTDSARGYTMVELVAVIVIAGILAAVAAPRFFGVNPFEQRGFLEEARAAVGFAHKLAIASGCSIRVTFDAGGFRLRRWVGGSDCRDRAGGTLQFVQRPGGGDFDSVSPSSVGVGGIDFYFDRVGRPRDPGTGAVITNPAALTVSIGPAQIRVEPETGLVRGNS